MRDPASIMSRVLSEQDEYFTGSHRPYRALQPNENHCKKPVLANLFEVAASSAGVFEPRFQVEVRILFFTA